VVCSKWLLNLLDLQERMNKMDPLNTLDPLDPPEKPDPLEPMNKLNTLATGETGPGETGPTGPTYDPTLFPTAATGPVEPPQIASLEELMQSHAVVVTKETTDRQSLSGLINPLRDQYRPQLFQWAAAGFPPTFVVQMFDITPPNICSDGVSRDPMAYLQFLLNPTTFDTVLENIRTLMPGIAVSFSFSGNTLRIHVSKP
jgi:hypothetical protein